MISNKGKKAIQWRKDNVQQIVLEQWHMLKDYFRPLPHTILKINSKRIIDLNVGAKTIILLGMKWENIGENLCWVWIRQRVLGLNIKNMIHKTDKLDFMKIKSLYTLKNTIKKRQAINWEKNLQIVISEKILVSRVYKKLL